MKSSLRFTPYAWAKLLYMRDKGSTEVGGFAITHHDDNLLIEDFCLVKQECTSSTVDFDDTAIADFVEDMMEDEYQPYQFTRIWIHTHPGSSPYPSSVDEDTFKKVFGTQEMAVMFIIAKEGKTYARLKVNSIAIEIMLPVEIVWNHEFYEAKFSDWNKEYNNCVEKKTYTYRGYNNNSNYGHGYQQHNTGYYQGKSNHGVYDDWGDDFYLLGNVYNEDTDLKIEVGELEDEKIKDEELEQLYSIFQEEHYDILDSAEKQILIEQYGFSKEDVNQLDRWCTQGVS